MTPEDALIELLDRLGARRGEAVLISEHELDEWPPEAVAAMRSQKLLTKAPPASTAICPGCERECPMLVHTLPATTQPPIAFIVCDKRSDVNRVPVPAERLVQWRSNAEAVCRFIAQCLGLRRTAQRVTGDNRWPIGVASGNRRHQMLCLKADEEVVLLAGGSAVPLAEFIEFGNDAYSLDDAAIRRMVDSATAADERYTPNSDRREEGKLHTQARHETWRAEYRRLKKKHPDKSDAWCSQQIAKMPIAKGRNAETIRRQLKN